MRHIPDSPIPCLFFSDLPLHILQQLQILNHSHQYLLILQIIGIKALPLYVVHDLLVDVRLLEIQQHLFL